MSPGDVVAIVGPTGVGKSAVAVELAHALGAEIVSCDSMQVYRRMLVLSQAPTSAQRRQVPHHLVDCVEPTEPFSVGQYRRAAAEAIGRALGRGKRVLLVGGTGLYLKALTEGLCHAPPADGRLREQLWGECQGSGSAALHHRLRAVDDVAASRIHPHDARRIIRALEVYALTGQPISAWWSQAHDGLLPASLAVVGLSRDRDELYQRINQRVVHMIYEETVIQEVRALLRLELSATARQVHGLGDLERYLSGSMSLKEAIAVWQQRVRQYARRQFIWFRRTPGLQWHTIAAGERPWETAGRLCELVRQRPTGRPLQVAS